MGENKKMSAIKVITPKARLSFPALYEAKSYQNSEAKFSAVLIFDKNTNLKELKDLVKGVASEKWGSDEKKWPKNFRSPFRLGSEKEGLDGYPEDSIFISATTKQRPGIVDKDRTPLLTDDGTLYAGCYVRAQVNAYAYDKAGNKGVAFGLQNIQKMGDGEPLSGRQKAEEAFDSVDDSTGSDTEGDDEDNSFI